jgi:hypothetical protein
MELFRLHAYAVSPLRTTDDDGELPGGAVDINAELRATIEDNTRAARFERRTSVDFVFDTDTRSNEVRQHLLNFAFGEGATAKSAGVALASRLAHAMDRRSTACLFIPAAMRARTRRRVSLWTFPRDEAFQFRQDATGPSIQVVTNIFSQSSTLRKAALFDGRNARSDFLGGKALDFQANSVSRDLADFWIKRFLTCQFGIHDEAGTRLLARTVRKAYELCASLNAKEQLYAAIMAIRSSPRRRVSLRDFANRYLDGEARDQFLSAAPEENAGSTFDFKRELFDQALKFRVFRLSSDVFVSSPVTEIGRSVHVRGTQTRRLSCEGEIVDEQMRSRHA